MLLWYLVFVIIPVMSEIKLDFAYSPAEAIIAARRSQVGGHSRIFLGASVSTKDDDYAKQHIDKMIEHGWSNDEIIVRCSKNLPKSYPHSIRRPLPELVLSGHPIVEEWDDNDVRVALNKMAHNRLAEIRTEQFILLINTGDRENRNIGYLETEAQLMQTFSDMLTHEATPAAGIRNK